MLPYHTLKPLALQHHTSSSVNLACTVVSDITYRLPDHQSQVTTKKGTQSCVPFHRKLVRALSMCLTKPDFYQVTSTDSELHTFFTHMESTEDHNDVAQTLVEFAQVVALAQLRTLGCDLFECSQCFLRLGFHVRL